MSAKKLLIIVLTVVALLTISTGSYFIYSDYQQKQDLARKKEAFDNFDALFQLYRKDSWVHLIANGKMQNANEKLDDTDQLSYIDNWLTVHNRILVDEMTIIGKKVDHRKALLESIDNNFNKEQKNLILTIIDLIKKQQRAETKLLGSYDEYHKFRRNKYYIAKIKFESADMALEEIDKNREQFMSSSISVWTYYEARDSWTAASKKWNLELKEYVDQLKIQKEKPDEHIDELNEVKDEISSTYERLKASFE